MEPWELPLSGWKVNPVLLAIFIGAMVIYKFVTKPKYKLPPGPWALPIVGHLLHFAFAKDKMYELLGKSWKNLYGPIFTVKFGGQRCVFLNNIELALEATVKKQTEFAGRPHIPSVDYITHGGKDIAMANYGPTWRLHRKIAYQAMKNYAVGEHLENNLHTVFEKIKPVLSELEEPVDPLKYFTFIIYNFICGFCWGTRYNLEDEEFQTLMRLSNEGNEVFGIGMPEDFHPILRYLPFPKRTKFLSIMQQFNDIISKKFYDHKETFDKDNIRDFIDDLLYARLEAKNETPEIMDQLTDLHLSLTLTDIFSAGTDTSRMTLHWYAYYMVKHPEVQSKVQEEIDRVVGRDRLPGLADREKLAYTEASLQEVMRIDTIVPLGLPHAALVDSTIGGYDVPKGTTVMFNVWAIHKDPQYWDDPDRYDPTRFLNADGTHAVKPYSYFPFSAGRRVCLGESVAKPELLLLVACLMQNFSFSLPPGETLTSNRLPGAVVNLPAGDFKILITPRN